MYVTKSVREIAHLHVLTDDNTISCLNEVKDQKTGAWQHHREEMGTATNYGTYNILKNIIERCVTIARETKHSHVTQVISSKSLNLFGSPIGLRTCSKEICNTSD